MPTERQKRVIKKTCENLRNKKVKSKGEILRECDYSDSQSKHPKDIYESKGVKQGLKPFIEQLEEERQRLFNSIKTKKLDKVNYDKAINSLDTLTKNIQLLGGKETDIIKSIEVVEIIEPK